jgi:DNA-binding transcriptional regulator YiaG
VDADELKAIRSQMGLTQAELANRLGLSHKDTVRAWEAGKTPIAGPAALALRLIVGLADATNKTWRGVVDGLWRGA